MIAERRDSLQKVESVARRNHRSGVAKQDKRAPLQSAGSDECHSARETAEQTEQTDARMFGTNDARLTPSYPYQLGAC